MIAEINKFCRTDLIVMDATEDSPPAGRTRGKAYQTGVILASRDRVAIDAVGVCPPPGIRDGPWCNEREDL